MNLLLRSTPLLSSETLLQQTLVRLVDSSIFVRFKLLLYRAILGFTFLKLMSRIRQRGLRKLGEALTPQPLSIF